MGTLLKRNSYIRSCSILYSSSIRYHKVAMLSRLSLRELPYQHLYFPLIRETPVLKPL